MSARRTAGIVCVILAAVALLFASSLIAATYVKQKNCSERVCAPDAAESIKASFIRGGIEAAAGLVLIVVSVILLREPKKRKAKK